MKKKFIETKNTPIISSKKVYITFWSLPKVWKQCTKEKCEGFKNLLLDWDFSKKCNDIISKANRSKRQRDFPINVIIMSNPTIYNERTLEKSNQQVAMLKAVALNKTVSGEN